MHRLEFADSEALASPTCVVDSGEGGVEGNFIIRPLGLEATPKSQKWTTRVGRGFVTRRAPRFTRVALVDREAKKWSNEHRRETTDMAKRGRPPRHARATTEREALERTKSFRGSAGVNLELVSASACH